MVRPDSCGTYVVQRTNIDCELQVDVDVLELQSMMTRCGIECIVRLENRYVVSGAIARYGCEVYVCVLPFVLC